ncbi:hypothetical protein N574_11610 [Lactiplantibacillus plantarum 2165]|nr:hypothetical protein N574_11610 [Lactiplantibacillus plantarum 2165]
MLIDDSVSDLLNNSSAGPGHSNGYYEKWSFAIEFS